MADIDVIKRLTKEVFYISENVKETIALLQSDMKKIVMLDNDDKLTIPYCENRITKCSVEIVDRNFEIKKYNHFFFLYENEMAHIDKIKWDDYLSNVERFQSVRKEFDVFYAKYNYYVPKNAKYLEETVRKILYKKGFIVDSEFEGDYFNWIGVYARPKDKPTYLDANTAEEAELQNKYSVGGFKQDFSEWFEWEIQNGKIIE